MTRGDSSWNANWTGKAKSMEESHPSATLSMTYSRLPDLELNPGSRGEKPASNRLTYGTDFVARSLIISNATVSNYLYIITVTLGAI
jgi:hypothetical protein